MINGTDIGDRKQVHRNTIGNQYTWFYYICGRINTNLIDPVQYLSALTENLTHNVSN